MRPKALTKTAIFFPNSLKVQSRFKRISRNSKIKRVTPRATKRRKKLLMEMMETMIQILAWRRFSLNLIMKAKSKLHLDTDRSELMGRCYQTRIVRMAKGQASDNVKND